jgi:hypothetical protein
MVTNLDKKQIDLIRESLCVYGKARECKTLLRQQKLFFENIQDFIDDRGRSCLFRLKEMCHVLFRNSTEASYKEKLFDMTVGYTFHGAMKLRENLYLLQYYQPQSEIALHDLSPQERKIVNEIGMLVRKAQARLKEEFKEVATLSDELVEQIKGPHRPVQGELSSSPFFIRERKAAVENIWPERLPRNTLHDTRRGEETPDTQHRYQLSE